MRYWVDAVTVPSEGRGDRVYMIDRIVFGEQWRQFGCSCGKSAAGKKMGASTVRKTGLRKSGAKLS